MSGASDAVMPAMNHDFVSDDLDKASYGHSDGMVKFAFRVNLLRGAERILQALQAGFHLAEAKLQQCEVEMRLDKVAVEVDHLAQRRFGFLQTVQLQQRQRSRLR